MPGKLVSVVSLGAAALLLSSTAAAAAGTVREPATPIPDPSVLDNGAFERMLRAPDARRADRPGRVQAERGLPPPLVIEDNEPSGTRGVNDSLTTAQNIDGFGSGRTANARARVNGSLSPQGFEAVALEPSSEDDGAIPLASDTGISSKRPAIRTTGTIGDGPHGSQGDKTGDYDLYRIDAVAGKLLTVDIDPGSGDLIPALVLYNASGTMTVGAQDLLGGKGKVHLSYVVPKTGSYFLSVASAAPLPFPLDPFRSGSGVGIGSEGAYDLTATVHDADTDFFAVDLKPGDVLGATVGGQARRVTVLDSDGTPVQSSASDMSAIYPAASPLPGGGNATVDHVAATRGRHYVAFTDGAGRYDATVEVYRPAGEQSKQPQTLFLDFDGARVNNSIFSGAATKPGVRELSPFRAFLQRWGLDHTDERAVIKAITRTVRENLRHDIRIKGNNPRAEIRVLDSSTHKDTFGKESVSRVIVGGTVEEAGIIPVIGIAQSIDPGNFARNETALVLLDRVSEPAGNPVSLNTYFNGKSDRVEAIGKAIGNVVSHEAGHYLGNWHTDSYDNVSNIMDTGHIFDLYALGPDGAAGTADDTDTDFAPDIFDPLQGFSATEDTINRTAFGLSRRSWLLP